MSSDDLTRGLQDGEDKTTQPTITAVFRLLHEVKLAVENVSARLGETNERLDVTNARLDATNARLDVTNARLDATNARLDEMETRLARDLADVDVRLSDKMESGFASLGDKIDALNRGRLQTEAEQSNILRRIRELESKAS